jgi:hypothetical protein
MPTGAHVVVPFSVGQIGLVSRDGAALCCSRVVGVHMARSKVGSRNPFGITAGTDDSTFFKNCH